MEEKKEKCRSAVNLAIAGAIAGFILPSIGVALAISGFITNGLEHKHYSTEEGFIANIVSLLLSLMSWAIGAHVAGLL